MTDEEVRNLLSRYENIASSHETENKEEDIEQLPYIPDGEFDPLVGREAVALGRLAKKGSWDRIKERFRDHPQYAELLKAAGEREEE